MLFGCYDEKEMWISELDRIIMFKAMVDHGLTLDEYKFDIGSYQDWDSTNTFIQCLKAFAEHYGVEFAEGEQREFCVRLKFHFDEQCLWGYERSKLLELKEELKQSLQSVYSDCIYSQWEDESTLKVDLEGSNDHGQALNSFLEAFDKIKPYLEESFKHVSDHYDIGTVATTY